DAVARHAEAARHALAVVTGLAAGAAHARAGIVGRDARDDARRVCAAGHTRVGRASVAHALSGETNLPRWAGTGRIACRCSAIAVANAGIYCWRVGNDWRVAAAPVARDIAVAGREGDENTHEAEFHGALQSQTACLAQTGAPSGIAIVFGGARPRRVGDG